ncbi:MAG: MFS transporter [Geodermatophilaceae bacterium]|nr:MFS transporter [Geodermatophilaceae bacterium]
MIRPKDPLGGNFWRLLAASAVSNLGDGIVRTAVPLLAITLTRDPLLIGALTSLSFLPWLLFAIPSGAVVDRMDRRRAMSVANFVRAAAVGGLVVAIAIDQVSLILLYVLTFVLGVAETVYDSAARAMLPQVVRRDQLDRGNGPLASAEVVTQAFLAAPIGSFLFAWLVIAPFVGSAAVYLLAALLILSITGNLRPTRDTQAPSGPTTLRGEIGEGLRWLHGHALLRGLAVIVGLIAAAETMANGLLVLYVVDTLGVPERAFGLFLVSAGVGGLLGGLGAPRIAAKLGRIATIVLSSAITSAATLGMGLTRNVWVGAVLFGLVAFAISVFNVLVISLRQALIPERLFGRVQGAYRTLVWGLIPLGALSGGLLAGFTSVPITFVISGIAQLVLTVLCWRLLRRHRDQIQAAHQPDLEPAESGSR